MTSGFGIKNIELRIRQFQVAGNPTQSLLLARGFIQAKIKNQRTLLRRNAVQDCQLQLDQLAQSIEDAGNAASLESLLGVEGNAARMYFQGFSQLLSNPETFQFLDRNRRPPKDPINAVLSFLYAMLIKEVHIALAAVGFEPLCGFFHQPRWGRPALALDLAEEFRPLLADSTALTLVNTGELQENHFIRRAGSCALTEAGKKRVIAGWERRLDKMITHPLFDYAVSYRRILEIQTRLLSRVIMGEISTYPGFTTR
jgi:CRISPR-associated protein Cas1